MQFVLILLIVVSLGGYLLAKRRSFHTKSTNRKFLFNTQASIWLSLFVILFAVNQFVSGDGLTTTIGKVVCSILIIIGVASFIAGFIRYKKIYPYVVREMEQTEQS
ncbi:YtpI family protein [Exiguobacterium artemiae]|uniref:YtpI family protein n=1 Tax=Exiguobacterium sp. S22-S28 TaxID=3342768 RepID=UPI0011C84EBD